MYDRIYGIYEAIIEATSSELVLGLIIIAVSILPLYGYIISDRRAHRKHEAERQDKDIQREKEIMLVFREHSTKTAENTAVLVSLKSYLESSNADTKRVIESGNADTKKSIERIHARIDDVSASNMRIETTLAKRTCIREHKDDKQ